MSIERKPPKWIETILRFAIRTIIKRRWKIVVESNDTLDLKPPYIILANHVNNWDPLFINCFVSETMCFVAGDSLFRNRNLKKILNFIGAIPKAKFKNDTNTIRSMLKAKKHHRIIGLFPEGNRNWDGTTEPIIFATAKLVKLLDIPVVIATIRGGYLSHPRWAEHYRKGLISITFKKLWDKGELKNETNESIHQKLTEALAHNEMDWQCAKQVPYKGKSLAHYLERLLFLCPHCKEKDSLFSDGDFFECRHCHYKVKYNHFGQFEQVHHNLIFTTTHEWNKWQLEFLKLKLLSSNYERPFDITDHVKLYIADGRNPFRHISTGNITWRLPSDKMQFQGDDGKDYKFEIKKLDGLNIHLHQYLDFSYEGIDYRMEFYQPRTSAYKWLKTFLILSEINFNKGAMS